MVNLYSLVRGVINEGERGNKIMEYNYLGLTDGQWLSKYTKWLNTMPEDDKRYSLVQASIKFLANRIAIRHAAEVDAAKAFRELETNLKY